MGIFEKENEERLNYDGHAFLYFALTALCVILIPWTCSLIRAILFPRPASELDFEKGNGPADCKVRLCKTSFMEARRQNSLQVARAHRFRGASLQQIICLAIGWSLLFRVLWELKDAPTELRSFDPYEILGVPKGAELREIKKAYHTKSLQHHPDKDKDNPLAPVLFQQVSKAYSALTDETARSNYEKYGNPDGAVQMKMGIALHPSLLVKENQIFTLCCFFGPLFLVPFSVVCCCLRGSNVSTGGVSAETLKIFSACLDVEVRAEDTPGLLAAAVEERRQICADIRPLVEAMAKRDPEPMLPGALVHVLEGSDKGRRGVLRRSTDGRCEVEVWPYSGPPQKPEDVQTKIFAQSALASVEPQIPCSFSDPPIRRGAAMLWAHLRRMHPHMSPMAQAELTNRLAHTSKLCRAMIKIAAHGDGDRSGFIEVVRGCIQLQRCLVQAIDFNDSPLLQLPHVRSVPKAAPSFQEVVRTPEPALLKRLGTLTPQQVLDIQSFCKHVPLVELSCFVEVDDEPDVAEGDLATLKVTLTRTNLEDSECAGPVHAPFFPTVKYEEWWLLVYDQRGRRMLLADHIMATGRVCESRNMQFLVPRPGDFEWTVFCLCDSYAGLDVSYDLRFRAAKKSEVDRSIFVHPEDAEIRTLFEELMLGLDQEQESESEESEEEEEEDKDGQESKKEEPEEDRDGCGGVTAAEAKAEKIEEKEPEKLESKELPDEGSDEEEKAVPEGSYFRIADPTGSFLYREPHEEVAARCGSIPKGAVLRGFQDPSTEGWLEVPAGPQGSVWARVAGAMRTDEKAEPGQPAEDLGPFLEMKLQDLVKGHAPVALVKRWIRHTTKDVTVEDLWQVREIDNPRARSLVEDLLHRRLGPESFSRLLDGAEALTKKFQQRIRKARGFFQTANGIVWHVAPDGEVKGLHQDGSKIRDRIQVSEEDQLQIGPFSLDEARTCSCIHWTRKDDPEKTWNWSRDNSLRTRVRLATGERA